LEIIFNLKTGVLFPNRQKNTQKTRRHPVARFIIKKVIAITVPDVLSSFAITRLRPNLRFPCPNGSPEFMV
jgi:hypothetical protein